MSSQQRLEQVLHGIATFAGVVAVLAFAFNVQLPVSPVTDSIFVAAVGVALFIAAQGITDDSTTVSLYIIATVAVASSAFKIVSLFNVGSIAVVFIFTAVAILFFGLAQWIQNGRLRPLDNENRIRYAITGVTIIIVVAVMIIDVAGGGVTTTVVFDNSTVVGETDTPRNEVTIGSYEIVNQGFLPRDVNEPQYQACLSGDWANVERQQDIPIRTEPLEQDTLSGGDSASGDIELFLPETEAGNTTLSGEIPIVEKETCQRRDDGPREIIVYSR